MSQKIRRRKYFIAKKSQTRFIVLFLLTSLGGGMLAVFGFWRVASEKLDTILYTMRLPKSTVAELLWQEILFSNATIILFSCLLFAFTSWKIKNRLNAPLEKIAKDLRLAREGEISHNVTLRKNDEFHEFAGDLNDMLSSLRMNLTTVREENKMVRQKLETLLSASNIDDADMQSIGIHLNSMQKQLQHYSERIS